MAEYPRARSEKLAFSGTAERVATPPRTRHPLSQITMHLFFSSPVQDTAEDTADRLPIVIQTGSRLFLALDND